MISVNLLSKVLKVPVQFGELGGKLTNSMFSFQLKNTKEVNVYKQINIHELAAECKVWAAHQNFKVESQLSYGVEKGKARLHHTQQMGFNVFGHQCQHTYHSDWFNSDSEPEAIFKACEWILK